MDFEFISFKILGVLEGPWMFLGLKRKGDGEVGVKRAKEAEEGVLG